MNIILIHKKFREVAIKRNLDKKQQLILNETKAQKRFDYLNEEVNQAAFNERMKQAVEDVKKAFDAIDAEIDSHTYQRSPHVNDATAYEIYTRARKIDECPNFQEGGKRVGKTQRLQEIICRTFGHSLDLATGRCSTCDKNFKA